MSWLYLPEAATPPPQTLVCSGCRSAPELAGSTSASPSHAPGIALSVTSSGKVTLRPSSWRGWKTRPWIKHLSGTTLEVSMANVVVGYGATQMLVFPLFGLQTTLAQNLKLGAVFSIVSIIRSFALRRVFEAIRVRMGKREAAPPMERRRQ